MKKIIFLLLLPISVFAKDWDSSQWIMLKANPIVLADGIEKGVILEYKFSKSNSIEIGAGYGNSSYGSFTLTNLYNPVTNRFGNIYTGNEHENFFSGRIAYRRYVYKGLYVSPVLFFRKFNFTDRTYEWNDNGNNSPDPIEETGSGYIFAGTTTENRHMMVADEKKLVVGFQFLGGFQYLIAGFIPFEIYGGLGVRAKIRTLSIKVSGDTRIEEDIVNPPYQKNITGLFPTIQFGIRIGLAFPVNKNKLYH